MEPKRIILCLLLLISLHSVVAQNGVYVVINQQDIKTKIVRQNLRSSKMEVYADESEHRGINPSVDDIDTAELVDVLAEWILSELGEKESDVIFRDIPQKITIKDGALSLIGKSNDTIETYQLKKCVLPNQQWTFWGSQGKSADLKYGKNDVYFLTMPEEITLKLRKMK